MACNGLLAVWKIDDGGSAAYVAVGETVMLSFPKQEVKKIEVNGLSYTNVKYCPGQQMSEGFTFECNFDGDVYERLAGLLGVPKGMHICSPPVEDVMWAFTGFICKLEGDFETDTVTKIKGEVCITDTITVSGIS